MLPVPSRFGLLVFAAIVSMWLIGALAPSWPATALASVLALLYATVLAATIPLGRRVRSERLEFAWWLSHEGGPMSGAVVPGVPFQVRCYVRHRGDTAVELTRLEPILPGPAEVLDLSPSRLSVSPRARNEFALSVRARAAGRVVLHGLSVHLRGPFGLFEVPLYFPNALAIKVLPRTVALTRLHLPKTLGLPLDQAGSHRMRRRGGGTELHELRELSPGDPFKSIAWKASAKQGRLMVREVEQEIQRTVMLVLDASGSMRGGEPGKRKLDLALDRVAAEARALLDRGDRVGLITVDGRITSHLPPGEGLAHMVRIYDALLAVTEVVDADLTTVDDAHVADIVGRYVRHQDGVDYARAEGRGWDVAALSAHVLGQLGSRAERRSASAPTGVTLRRFCRQRGIVLPHRATPIGGDKARGLTEALLLAAENRRATRHVSMISDLDESRDLEPLLLAARVIQKHGNTLTIAMPDPMQLDPQPSTAPIAETLRSIYALGERRRMREVREAFSRVGVVVTSLGPDVFGHGGGRGRVRVA